MPRPQGHTRLGKRQANVAIRSRLLVPRSNTHTVADTHAVADTHPETDTSSNWNQDMADSNEAARENASDG